MELYWPFNTIVSSTLENISMSLPVNETTIYSTKHFLSFLEVLNFHFPSCLGEFINWKNLLSYILCNYVSVGTILSLTLQSSFLFWSGLRDPIACSLLGGGIPNQNSGYKSTRLCPSKFRFLLLHCPSLACFRPVVCLG